ncbi:MAG TPA: DUF4159 domain-containing protein [Vicinamibacterales bacterium]|nr:DUF4159 domain-containing protein [Vicinamibacterales bacterium]
MSGVSWKPWRVALAVVVLAALATQVEAQRRRSFGGARIATADDFDGRFHFCRVVFDGGSWSVDWPRADINLSIRLSELTKTTVSQSDGGEPNHLLVRLTDPEMFSCPFIMMTEVGRAYFSPEEAARLRDYLLKGGFLWADDFWGTDAWEWWEEQFSQVLPPQDYPIVDLDPSHPLFRSHFVVKQAPQIASINFWYGNNGSTSERGADSAEVHVRAVLNRQGQIMALMTHNTDFGDSFEREGDDPTYFLNFSVPGYAFGINTLLYAMTH